MTTRCDLTDLLVDQCAHCLGHEPASPLDDLRIERFLTARYDGVCVIDQAHRIEPGDNIGLAEGGGYACTRCTNGAAGG